MVYTVPYNDLPDFSADQTSNWGRPKTFNSLAKIQLFLERCHFYFFFDYTPLYGQYLLVKNFFLGFIHEVSQNRHRSKILFFNGVKAFV